MTPPQAPNRPALDALERYRADIIGELRQAVGSSIDPPYPLMRYHLGWEDAQGAPLEHRGGKLLRPALLLLCCESLGGDPAAALPASAAVELLHNFTLLHDDVEDASETRHGRKTAWCVWGQAEAINAGDGMFALAHRTVLRLSETGHPPERVLAATRLLDEATINLCEGQHRDLRLAGTATVSVSAYMAMIEGKTAALLAASCAIGALLAGAGNESIAQFHEFGRRLGLAFQVQDDVLGCWGDAVETGKSSGDDIRAGKRSYPIVIALERASPEQRDTLGSTLGNEHASDSEVASVREFLESLGARDDGQRAAQEHADAAIAALQGLSPGDHRSELEALARFAAARSA